MFEFLFDKFVDIAAGDTRVFLLTCLAISAVLVLLSFQFGKYHNRRAKHFRYLGQEYAGEFGYHRFWAMIAWGLVPVSLLALSLTIIALLIGGAA